MSNLKEKALEKVEQTHYLRCYSEYDKNLIATIITEFTETEIQQLKKELFEWQCESYELNNLYCDLLMQVEAAKTILNRVKIPISKYHDDYLCYSDKKELDKLLNDLRKVFSEGFSAEKSSLAGETTK